MACVAWVGALWLAVPAVLAAHPIHTTYGEVTVNREAVTLRLRIFADDLATAVARHAARPVPNDSTVRAADLSGYLQATLRITDAAGQRIAVTSCGVQRAGVVTLVCVRFPVRAGLRVQHGILADLHADQVNILQVRGGRTLLFTATSAEQSLLP